MQELGCSSERMSKLMAKALQRRDALAFKVVRNLSQHGGPVVQAFFVLHIEDIIKLLLVGCPFWHAAFYMHAIQRFFGPRIPEKSILQNESVAFNAGPYN